MTQRCRDHQQFRGAEGRFIAAQSIPDCTPRCEHVFLLWSVAYPLHLLKSIQKRTLTRLGVDTQRLDSLNIGGPWDNPYPLASLHQESTMDRLVASALVAG